jgi:hypothetical protein
MTYNKNLSLRINKLLAENPALVEKKMFGGVGYLLQGNMACGVNKDDLIVRIGPESYGQAVIRPHVRPFDITGRPMKGWILVSPAGYNADEDLSAWVEQGVSFALSLPAK